MGTKILLAVLVCAFATSLASAAGRVVVMPDQQARPAQSIQLFGAATNNGAGNLGDGSAVGEAYVWSYTPNPNVTVFDDGNLTGVVGNDRFIAEAVSFSLVASTRESITWTLTVGGQPSSNTVTIDIVDPTDAISDTPLENLAVDVNIATREGLKYLYQQQQPNGSWVEPNWGSDVTGAVTGFCTWALANDGHVPTDDPDQDVYAEFVADALAYLEGTATVQSTLAAAADVPREAVAPQTTDLNSNQQSLKLASSDTWAGYSHPIATAAFLASLDTASYQTLVEDAIDYIGHTQNAGAGYCSANSAQCTPDSACSNYCTYHGTECEQASDCPGYCPLTGAPCAQAGDCPANCAYWGNPCAQDSDCQGFCAVYGGACTQASDCTNYCSVTFHGCTEASDCPNRCSITGGSCTEASDCPNRCSGTGSACTQASDCPGYCAVSGHACTQASDCPGRCSYDNSSCTQDSDCLQSFCSITDFACTMDDDCPFVGSGETCVLEQTCIHAACNLQTCSLETCILEACNQQACERACQPDTCNQQTCAPQTCIEVPSGSCTSTHSPCEQTSDCPGTYCSALRNACTQASDCLNYCAFYRNPCTQNSDCTGSYCSWSGGSCTQDGDCSSYCSYYGNACTQDSDCTGNYCTYWGNSCSQNSDCANWCSFSGSPCTSDTDCPSVGFGNVCTPGTCSIETCRSQVCNIETCNSQTCAGQHCIGTGGWDYTGPSNRSDYSINSWNWMAIEGAATTSFAVDAPDWILQESEKTLITHQTNPPDQLVGQPYGYDSETPLLGHPNHGHATTCAGLSGLAAVEHEDAVAVGSLIGAEPAPLDSVTARRNAALAWLGEKWNIDSNGTLGEGNRGNPYSHWTCCRGLRLTEAALGIPADSLTLVNGGVSFNWATGEENNSGNVAAPGSPREGYLPWIVRHQLPNGQWNFPAYTGTVLESCLNMLCLNPVVFGSCGDGTVVPPEQCDDGNTVDGDGCSSNCTFEAPPCDDASVLPPQCEGRCPEPDLCQYAPSLQRCACRPTLVTLESFTAEAEPGGVRLRWKTTSEIDTYGFRVLLQRRGESPVAISPLIPSQGSELVGAEYEYFDTGRKRLGKAYTYYLEDVDTQGVSTVRAEPVGIVIESDRARRPVSAEAPRQRGR